MSDFRTARESETSWGWIAGYAAVAIVLRLVPYLFPNSDVRSLWNFSAVGALGLFVGARLSNRAAYVVPVVVMMLSDLLLMIWLGGQAFGWLTPIIYACYVFNVFLGRFLKETTSPLWAIPGALATATVFFVVTNFACWIGGDGVEYPKTVAGLIECYTKALLFFRNTLAGDLMYSALFFGLHAAAVAVTQREKVSQPA
jgi:hypothetical protein